MSSQLNSNPSIKSLPATSNTTDCQFRPGQRPEQSNLSRRVQHGDRSNRRGARRVGDRPVRTNATGNEETNAVDEGAPGVDSSAMSQVEQSRKSSGRVIGYKGHGGRGGAAPGKHRQRNHTNQLIEGLADMDLAEAIVPTCSSDLNDPSRNRNRTNVRKMNLTHLINSNYERKRPNNRHRTSSNENYAGVYRRNPASHYRDAGNFHKFNKQQFLQANCQFVVLDGHDYTVHKADPDWPVEWDCVEEVRFKQIASTETTCPICLEPPVAAKITRCGHIYCWTCMLQYLALTDEKNSQCPICFERINGDDLRSVVSHSFTSHSVEDEITMKLMIRRKGCVEVEPYHKDLANDSSDQSYSNNDYCSRANLVIVDSQTALGKIVGRENQELQVKLALDKDEPEVCFIEQALKNLEERVERLNSHSSLRPTKKSVTESTGQDSQKNYLFYQISDGQHVYLDPFSTKVLTHEYGSLEKAPLEIKSKILQMDWISMNEGWRKRFRYLEHLPLTCEFRLIELDFSELDLVSRPTYLAFENQIKWREQERQKRKREERKREKIVQVELNRRIYGIQPTVKINLNSIDQFPTVSDERYLDFIPPKNQSNEETYEFLSDGEDDEIQQSSQKTPLNRLVDDGSTAGEQESVPPPTEAHSNAPTMSFKDIQLQEAALARVGLSSGAPSVWAKPNGKATNSSGTQSSFAQLVVNAKASQKPWTRNSGPNPGQRGAPVADFGERNRTTSGGSDDAEGELRAPPSRLTISDFIDMNLISTIGKKKGKSKNIGKKG